jgi:alkylated DNA repair dioxygenase AlkB
MGFHKDDETELDPAVPIASLTLGAERDFIFR